MDVHILIQFCTDEPNWLTFVIGRRSDDKKNTRMR